MMKNSYCCFMIALGAVAGLSMLSGCGVLVAGGATATGIAAADERSFGTVIDDGTIHAEITHLFFQSDVNDLLPHVIVRVNEGRVLLTGVVARQQTSVEAVRLAWLAKGVREVINEIKVSQPGGFGAYARDEAIEAQISARMLATKNIRSLNYTVEVVDGVAYLLGLAQDEREMKAAAWVASHTKGVRKVVSYVRLKSDPARPKALKPE